MPQFRVETVDAAHQWLRDLRLALRPDQPLQCPGLSALPEREMVGIGYDDGNGAYSCPAMTASASALRAAPPHAHHPGSAFSVAPTYGSVVTGLGQAPGTTVHAISNPLLRASALSLPINSPLIPPLNLGALGKAPLLPSLGPFYTKTAFSWVSSTRPRRPRRPRRPPGAGANSAC